MAAHLFLPNNAREPYQGRHDAVMPVETRQAPLLRLLRTPAEHKRHVTFESHHVPARIEMMKEMLEWLDRYLGPVARPADVAITSLSASG